MPDKSPGRIVLKFGGTSISTAEKWEHIVSIVRDRREQGYAVCLVQSAISGISNSLQSLAEQDSPDSAESLVDSIKKRHLQLGEELGIDASDLLGDLFEELDRLAKGISLVGEASYRTQARLMALGELMSTRIGNAYLQQNGLNVTWMDARTLLKTVPQPNASEKSLVLSAVCEIEQDDSLIRKLEKSGDLVLTQGFIASDAEGKTVLLGRGGSDVSAAYLAAKLNAERLEIWTDVPGMFSANPHTIPSARLLRQLSYEEAQEIATNGAKVLHPRCIMPARVHQIPIHIKDTDRPDHEGTVISSAGSGDEALVKAIAVRDDVILVSLDSLGMWQQVGFLADAFEIFKTYGLSIDLVSTSESNVTVSLDPGLNTHFREVREQFVHELEKLCRVRVIETGSAVSLLGRHIRTILHQLGPAFEVFQEHEIYLVSQAANDLNFTFVVESEQADRLVRQLHEQVISKSSNRNVFGPTWEQISGKKEEVVERVSVWWKDKRDHLLQVAQEESPVYVYSLEAIQSVVDRLGQLSSVDRLFYAVKANANREVLACFHEAGLGFECVSIGEVEFVLKLFPEIDRDRILFTPNFAPRAEYGQALNEGVHVTLDNIFPLKKWPDLFEEKHLFLRIDPGHGHGHHKHVRTGGVHSKFGIPMFELEEARSLLDEIGAEVKGLHAHLGSGIKDPRSWRETALLLVEAAEYFEGVEILDVGGGLGIRENEMQTSLDLGAVDQSLREFRAGYPQFELWMEPGRYLVASAGVLLTRITQLKGKGDVRYVGVDTGMNSFIRPALYGAHHSIVNLDKIDEPADQLVNVVGPICESGDKLGIDRLFPESEEGDVVLIANAGAYGRVMSSSYNLRMPAKERVI